MYLVVVKWAIDAMPLWWKPIKYSSPESLDQLPWNLIYSMWDYHHQNTFPLWNNWANFICSLTAKRERKFIFVKVTCPRWPSYLYKLKTLKRPSRNTWLIALNLVCCNRESNTKEYLYKWYFWVDLALFYSKVKFGP